MYFFVETLKDSYELGISLRKIKKDNLEYSTLIGKAFF
jgi:hypothetical protein